jgi:hypothetical protein
MPDCLPANAMPRRSARKAIKAKLKAQGIKVGLVPLREINALVNDYLAEHRAFFIVEAKQAIARVRSMAFALCRYAVLFTRQITPKRALKRLRFLVQLLRFSAARAY